MKLIIKRTLLAWAALAALDAATVTAQPFTLDWSTIDGGSGTSTGGGFSLVGTLGQPDAGTMTGGGFALTGGFWGVVAAIQGEGMPILSVSRNPANGAVTLSWPLPATGFLLDQAGALNNVPLSWARLNPPYQTNATHVFITVPAPAGDRFYRLHKP